MAYIIIKCLIIFAFIIVPLFFISFFLFTLIRDQTRDFTKMKMIFGTKTNNNTGKTKLELRYLVWERKKRKFYINYLKQNKIIYLEGDIFLEWEIYYKDKPPFKYGDEKSFIHKSIRIFTK